jgi:hypothetical protein
VLRDDQIATGAAFTMPLEDLGEPDCRIGEVSPIIGKVPGTPGS